VAGTVVSLHTREDTEPTVLYRHQQHVVLTAAVLARTAAEGARVALVMLATQRANSPALGGALVAALMIPHVAAAPAAGALVDSVRRRRLYHGGAVTLYGAVLAALAVLVGRAYDPVVLLLVAAAGCVAPCSPEGSGAFWASCPARNG
jgi:MFS family permease